MKHILFAGILILSYSSFAFGDDAILAKAKVVSSKYCTIGDTIQLSMDVEISILNSGKNAVSIDAVYNPTTYRISNSIANYRAGRYEFAMRSEALDNPARLYESNGKALEAGGSIEVSTSVTVPIGKSGLKNPTGHHFLTLLLPTIQRFSGRYIQPMLVTSPARFDVEVPNQLHNCQGM